MSPPLTLVVGSKHLSSWSMRPWVAMREAGVPFAETVVALDMPGTRAEIARYSPSGRVPVLLAGDLAIWDSLAICEYVAETIPAAHLWPADPRARAVARAVSAEMHGGFAALRAQLDFDLHRDEARAPNTAAAADLARIFDIVRDCRARFGQHGGPLLFGAFSIADAMYAPVVARLKTYRVPLDGVVRDYADAVWALAATRAWVEAGRLER